MNVDYRGRLTLCCNLSGFRGGAADADVVGDLNCETFESAHRKLVAVANGQLRKRNDKLAELRNAGVPPDLFTGSPCLFCLQSFEKVPWHDKLYKVAAKVAKD